MNILKLELTHFGKFHLKTITFTSGLNIVYGKNEAGKSTIHAFVRSMLFGIPDTEEGNERYSHYLPWETPHDFCGRMWIKKDDKVYRIERNFLRPQPTVRVFDDETGESLQPAKQHLRQILSGLTETSYLNTICIEQLKSATDPQLAKELEDMAVNASQSKNLNIDVKQAKQELLLKKQSLQSQIINDVDIVHQKNQKMADESGKRLSRLQRSRYIREKQSSDLQTKIETERRQAEEELMAYERERNELRRRYESDKKASENAANANMTAAGGHGWLIWLVLAVLAGAFSIYRYSSVGMTNRGDFWMITIGACAVFVCLVSMFLCACFALRLLCAHSQVQYNQSLFLTVLKDLPAYDYHHLYSQAKSDIHFLYLVLHPPDTACLLSEHSSCIHEQMYLCFPAAHSCNAYQTAYVPMTATDMSSTDYLL